MFSLSLSFNSLSFLFSFLVVVVFSSFELLFLVVSFLYFSPSISFSCERDRERNGVPYPFHPHHDCWQVLLLVGQTSGNVRPVFKSEREIYRGRERQRGSYQHVSWDRKKIKTKKTKKTRSTAREMGERKDYRNSIGSAREESEGLVSAVRVVTTGVPSSRDRPSEAWLYVWDCIEPEDFG